MEVRLRLFLTSALNGGEWSSLFRGHFTQGKNTLILTEQEGGWAPEPVCKLDFPYRESNHGQFVSCLLYQVMAKGECYPSECNLISTIQPIGIHYIDSGLTVRCLKLLTVNPLAVTLCVVRFNTEFQNFAHTIHLFVSCDTWNRHQLFLFAAYFDMSS
jgi:hypothetical protein